MIQIQKPKNKRKLLIILGVVALLVLAVGAYLYFSWKDTASNDTINTEKPTKQQIKAGQTSKDAAIKGESQDTGNLDTNESSQADSAATPQISITAANQNGDIVQVRSLIPAITTSGTCTLMLKSGSSVVTKTASVQALADSSTCQGFDISSSEFANKGTWNATLTYTDSSGSTETSKDIIIK